MPKTSAARSFPLLLVVACAFLFVSGYFVVRFPDVEGAEYASYGFNLLIALPAFVALVHQFGAARGAATLVAVSDSTLRAQLGAAELVLAISEHTAADVAGGVA